MTRVPVCPYELNCVEQGSDSPVLLIHGLAGDPGRVGVSIETFDTAHRVIAFDNRGAGKEYPGRLTVDEPISTEDMAQDTLALMDALETERAHVVGRSMGGAIGQQIAHLGDWCRTGVV